MVDGIVGTGTVVVEIVVVDATVVMFAYTFWVSAEKHVSAKCAKTVVRKVST